MEKMKSKKKMRVIAFGLWLIVLLGFWYYMVANQLSFLAATEVLVSWIRNSAYSPILFVGVLLIRPLTLFPIFLIALAAGYLFGPLLGNLVVFVGGTVSAYLGYVLGSNFGQVFVEGKKSSSLIKKYAGRMKAFTLETVLFLRMMYLNWDLISFTAGFLQIPLRPFMLGTLIGGTLVNASLVLLGSGIQGGFNAEGVHVSGRMIALSVFLAVGCITASKKIRSARTT